jgi:transposase-like protein
MVIPLPCSFHSISFDVDATHAPTISQIIWSTSYHHVTLLVRRSWSHLLFTVASVHRRQIITQLALHTCNRSIKKFISRFVLLLLLRNFCGRLVMIYVSYDKNLRVSACLMI